MKTSILILSAMMLLSSVADLTFTAKVQGAEQKDVLTEGLRASELTQLTITASDEHVSVLAFEIIHARGKSPVNRGNVSQGNTFDLSAFRNEAKPGDRIVVNVTRISGDNDKLSKKNSILTIPIR